MAQTEAAKAPAQAPAKPKAPGSKVDLGTLLGILLALTGIVGGLILEKGRLSDILQGTAALIVLGGTFGAVLVTMPLAVVIRAFKGLGRVFFEPPNSTQQTIDSLIQYATKARKNGIVSLESEAAEIPDPFLRKALGLAVDGTDLQEMRR